MKNIRAKWRWTNVYEGYAVTVVFLDESGMYRSVGIGVHNALHGAVSCAVADGAADAGVPADDFDFLCGIIAKQISKEMTS